MKIEISTKNGDIEPLLWSPGSVVTMSPTTRLSIKVVNDNAQELLLGEGEYKVDVHSDSPTTTESHCDEVIKIFIREINKMVSEKVRRSLFDIVRGYLVRIPPNQSLEIENISLGELSRHVLFKNQNHQFLIILTFKGVSQNFILQWNPNMLNLYYEGREPFYINLAQDNTLEKLCLSSDELAKWVNLSNNPPQFGAADISGIGLTARDTGSETHKTAVQWAISTFQLNPTAITKRDNTTVVFSIPIRKIDINDFAVTQDVPADLKVILTDRASGKEIATCLIAVVLQRPSFLGHAALDFGTTNSVCAYSDPQKGMPDFPNKTFSPLQALAARSVLDELLEKLENKVVKEPTYRILISRLTQFAAQMWAMAGGGNIREPQDIRNYLKNLDKQGKTKAFIGAECAKLLVSWGTHNYANFCQLREVTPEIARFLAKQYHTCVDNIINIDIQQDTKIFLAELEPEANTISSAMLMKELVDKPVDTTKSPFSYPQIDSFRSTILMGIDVQTAMRDPNTLTAQDNQRQLENEQQNTEVHKTFLTGTKRWIGETQEAYFVDQAGKIFRDVYDPLCELGIKHLLHRAEKFIPGNEGKTHINDLVVTYPANMSQLRRQRLKEIVQKSGVNNVDLSFDEATAGALYYVWQELFADLFAGIDGFLARSRVTNETMRSEITQRDVTRKVYLQNILIYDIGGGTTDIALLEVGMYELTELLPQPTPANCGRYFVIRPKILGLTGRNDFAGDNVTLAVFRILKSKLAAYVAPLLAKKEKSQLSPTQQKVLERFNEFEKSQSENLDAQKINYFTQWFTTSGGDYHKSLKNDIDALVATNFNTKPEQRFAFFTLWSEAEKIKQALSGNNSVRNASGASLLPAIKPLKLDSVSENELNRVGIGVTREEMENVIKLDIRGTFEKARDLCIGETENGKRPQLTHSIDRVVLAGSSSHLRLVREIMPKEVLGESFKVTYGSGEEEMLPAPFKWDKNNLIFNPRDTKLAVARGACLPHLLKRAKVDPRHGNVPNLLKNGTTFLDFDVDNLRHYVPFTLKYGIGLNQQVLFKAGEVMIAERAGEKVARKKVTPMEVISCYRVENSFSAISNENSSLYCQFNIDDAIANKDNPKDARRIADLKLTRTFYIEFDIERNLTCWMYTNDNGNADAKYINQTVNWDKTKLALLAASVCDKQKEAKPTLQCDSNGNKPDVIELKAVSNSFVGKLAMRKIFNLRIATGELLGQIDVSGYQVKNPGDAELRITLELQSDNKAVILKYTLFDPDFNNPEDNTQIKPSPDKRKPTDFFNPFRGDE